MCSTYAKTGLVVNIKDQITIKKDRMKMGISGKASDIKSLSVNGQAITVRPDNKFYSVVELPNEAEFELRYEAVDHNGQTIEKIIKVKREGVLKKEKAVKNVIKRRGLVGVGFGPSTLTSRRGNDEIKNKFDRLELDGFGGGLSYEKNFNGVGLELRLQSILLSEPSKTWLHLSPFECDINSFGVSYFWYPQKKVFKGFYVGPGFDYMMVKITENTRETGSFFLGHNSTEYNVKLGSLTLSLGYSFLIADFISIRLSAQSGYLFKLKGAERENYTGSLDFTDRSLMNLSFQFGVVI